MASRSPKQADGGSNLLLLASCYQERSVGWCCHRLVESLAVSFEPAKYQDTYRQNLRALIDAKVRGEEVKTGAEHPTFHPVPDILEALKATRHPARAFAI